MSQFRGYVWVAKLLWTSRIKAYRTPNTSVPVANAILESEVPAYSHELGYILSYPSVSAVVPFSDCSPTFWRSSSRHVNRQDTNGQGCSLTRLDSSVCNVERLVVEHASHLSYHVSVYPYLSPIIETRRLEPNALALELCRHDEFCAEPIGIELTSHLCQVWDKIVRELVVLSVVRLWINLLFDEVRQDSRRHDGFCPTLRVETRHGNLPACCLSFPCSNHVPSLLATMLKPRIKRDTIVSVASQNGQHNV